ncbi:MAG: hypothetical protein IT384_22680 [Deltaproteobacteria bacterium]|nr:hypothetical protein [Deltaproteobacteria bacterium]
MYIEEIDLLPVQGTFDTQRIRLHFDAQLNVAPDPRRLGAFVIAKDPEMLQYELEQFEADQDLVLVSVVRVEPGRVRITHRAIPETIAPTKRFVRWMLDHFECRILDDMKADITERIGKNADELFPPE